MMENYQLQVKEERVKIVEPVSYLNMIQLMRHAEVILTDSEVFKRRPTGWDPLCHPQEETNGSKS